MINCNLCLSQWLKSWVFLWWQCYIAAIKTIKATGGVACAYHPCTQGEAEAGELAWGGGEPWLIMISWLLSKTKSSRRSETFSKGISMCYTRPLKCFVKMILLVVETSTRKLIFMTSRRAFFFHQCSSNFNEYLNYPRSGYHADLDLVSLGWGLRFFQLKHPADPLTLVLPYLEWSQIPGYPPFPSIVIMGVIRKLC